MIYLASPYSHPDTLVRQARFEAVCRQVAILIEAGIMVFSPIAHTHPIVLYGLPKGWDFWEKYDREFIAMCSQLWILTIDGWRDSVGIDGEVNIASEMRKPILFIKYCETTARVKP